MGKIIPIGGVTKLDLPVDRILENSKGQYEGLVLIGFNKDGEPLNLVCTVSMWIGVSVYFIMAEKNEK